MNKKDSKLVKELIAEAVSSHSESSGMRDCIVFPCPVCGRRRVGEERIYRFSNKVDLDGHLLLEKRTLCLHCGNDFVKDTTWRKAEEGEHEKVQKSQQAETS